MALKFSITFVLAAIQLDVSESSSHFLIHLRNSAHRTGSCQLFPHAKQNVCPQRHVTGRDSTCWTLITLLQSGLGHHLNSLLHYKEKLSLLIDEFQIVSSTSFYLNKAVCYQVLIFGSHFGIRHEFHDGGVINQHFTIVSGTRNRLTNAFRHDLHCKIFRPTRKAKTMAAFQPRHDG